MGRNRRRKSLAQDLEKALKNVIKEPDKQSIWPSWLPDVIKGIATAALIKLIFG